MYCSSSSSHRSAKAIQIRSTRKESYCKAKQYVWICQGDEDNCAYLSDAIKEENKKWMRLFQKKKDETERVRELI
jgi:hypothetical protein